MSVSVEIVLSANGQCPKMYKGFTCGNLEISMRCILAWTLRNVLWKAGDSAGGSMGTTMRQTFEQGTEAHTDNALVNRIEDALLSVHPDLWLVGVVLVALAHFLGRMA